MNIRYPQHKHPIRPEHIDAGALYGAPSRLVAVCQQQGGWFPLFAEEAELDPANLQEIAGIITDRGQFYFTHRFLRLYLDLAPAVDDAEATALQAASEWAEAQYIQWIKETSLMDAAMAICWLLVGVVAGAWVPGLGAISFVMTIAAWPLLHPALVPVWTFLLAIAALCIHFQPVELCLWAPPDRAPTIKQPLPEMINR